MTKNKTNEKSNNSHKKYSGWKLAKRVWRDYLSDYKGRLFVAVLCMIIVGSATAIIAKSIQPIFDRAFHYHDNSLVMLFAGLIFLLFVVRGVANLTQVVLLQGIALKVIRILQEQMFVKLLSCELQYFHDHGAGAQLSRFSVDVGYLRTGIARFVLGVGRDLFSVVFLIGVMFSIDFKLSLFAFILLFCCFYPIMLLGKRLRKIANTSQQESSHLVAKLDDSFKGIRQIKAYNAEEYEKGKVFKIFHEVYRLSKKSVLVNNLRLPLTDTVGGLTLGIVVLWSGHRILNGEMTIGSFTAFFFAAVSVYRPVRSLTSLNASMQEALSALGRIFSVLDYKPNVQDVIDAKPFEFKGGDIQFDHVSFGYGGDVPAIQDITFQINKGQKVAFVGASGAGKTTIMNLIPRFYDVSNGHILVDGQDISKVQRASYLDYIALVSQEAGLFNDTIMENIAYGRRDATMDEIVDAAKHAHAHDFIEQLPNGYHTVLGESGIRVSGGQRQRISIARAFLKNAPILLLDEPTSALDTHSEQEIQKALNELMQDRTTIIIAHRLSTIQKADIIFVMDEGKIIASGGHGELLKTCDLYKKMCSLQFSGA